MPKARNYKREYKLFHSKPTEKKRRAERNAANAKARKEGRIKKGDGRDVHHVGASKKGSLKKYRTKVVSKKYNRSKK